MADDDLELDGIVIARLTVTRVMSGDDIIDHVHAATADGDELGLAEALGMLTLAQHTLAEAYARGDGE